MKGKICVITGANAGIGRETALGLARLGATVVMVCRDAVRGAAAQEEIRRLSGNDQVHLVLGDLSWQDSMRRAAQAICQRFERIDVLVNNAGGIFSRRQESPDGIELTFALNHLGYFLFTGLLLDKLKGSAPARVVNVSSIAHWLGWIHFPDMQFRRFYFAPLAYHQSKLANVMFTFSLAQRLAGSGVTVNCLHPGVINSNFFKKTSGFERLVKWALTPIYQTPEQGAGVVLYLASAPEVAAISGQYFVNQNTAPTSPLAKNRQMAERLWQESEKLTGFHYAE
ncbi:MAG TPA: SDR family oxidoreductase [Anaerolineaceae bacterium]|nr:SDR family oxidoreductase [Anaerolineaceae bacterium]HPN52230.1 SDR family oxidoreductase [Anaerolineaceae bacterium]